MLNNIGFIEHIYCKLEYKLKNFSEIKILKIKLFFSY